MLELLGVPHRYDWGTKDAIPKLLGTEPDDEPYAEYWLGSHELSSSTTSQGTLYEVLSKHPEMLEHQVRGAFGGRLPYLLKVLSAQHPISLQAHPGAEQAIDGFTRENTAKVPLDDPNRIYRDNRPKPEIFVALDVFEALSGFRDPIETARLFDGLGIAADLASVLGPLIERRGAAALAEVFLDTLTLEGERAHLLDILGSAAIRHSQDEGPVGVFARDILHLDDVFPGDRGIIAALLLNRITLLPGQAFYIAPGQMHVYLRGTGIELMANSDNVIRGGLTAKHIDVGELVRVVNFDPAPVPILEPVKERPGVFRYPSSCPEFALWRLELESGHGQIPLPAPDTARIAFTVAGSASINSTAEKADLNQGKALFISAQDQDVAIGGEGTVFLSAAGLSRDFASSPNPVESLPAPL
ncbi:MAG: mannose-6-phosphate isomerase, class I [Propionibacteriaceae bacterium]|jgi:mannose-6-phosphate isomerase|nr:mannose-6-phosphate isomerase, class I [Propionibacteriaceae bacterium]